MVNTGLTERKYSQIYKSVFSGNRHSLNPELHLIIARLSLSMVYDHAVVRLFMVFEGFRSQFFPSLGVI